MRTIAQNLSDFTSSARTGCKAPPRPLSPRKQAALEARQARQEAILEAQATYHADLGEQDWFKATVVSFAGEQFEGIVTPYTSTCQERDESEAYGKALWFNSLSAEDQAFYLGQWRAQNRARAIRRARRQVRWLVKSGEFNRLMTLTTRCAIYDREAFGNTVTAFLKELRKHTGITFQYVIALEKHNSAKTSEEKRGSWHAHVAVKGRQDYKLLYNLWNKVLGGNGAVHVQNWKGSNKGSPGMIASYISKYIGKDLEEADFGKKSYWASKNIPHPVVSSTLFRTYEEAKDFLLEYYMAHQGLLITLKRDFWEYESEAVGSTICGITSG